MIVKTVREGLGRLIILVDRLTRPASIQRTPAEQRQVEDRARALALYQFYACPFCVRVRRTVHRLGVPIEYRDAQHNPEHRRALLEGGGEIKVPCLRIEENGGTRWLYESADIIHYLEKRFGVDAS